MTTNIDRAADLIQDAVEEPQMYPGGGMPTFTAQALADAGLLMPEPAKPAVSSIEGYHIYHPFSIWHAGGLTVTRDRENAIHIDNDDDDLVSVSPGDVHDLIAALLAAADCAEQEQDNG